VERIEQMEEKKKTVSKDRLDELLATLFQAHPWHGVPSDDGGELWNAYIEIVPTDAVKYELDKPSGHLRLDRPQRFSSLPPTLYGFIPQTYCGPKLAERSGAKAKHKGIEGDGDPIDVCVLTEKATAHGNFLAHVRPIGGLRMIDGNQADDKIIAILENDLAYGHMRDLGECPRAIIDRLQHYFLTYKQRPHDPSHRVEIAEVYDRAEAIEMLRRSKEDYRDRYGAPETRTAELKRLLQSR
jgi:inorganic pyrophosphatase